jgi:hypothetical protein
VTGTRKTLTREGPIIVAFSIIILLYSFFIMGQLLCGLIVIFLLVILLRLIHAGANNPTKNPLLWILSIIIMSYSYFIGQLLWGLIIALQIAILWVLIYRISKKVKEPTGITVLAVFYAFTIFCGIVGLITGQSATVFGVTLSGVSARLFYREFSSLNTFL